MQSFAAILEAHRAGETVGFIHLLAVGDATISHAPFCNLLELLPVTGDFINVHHSLPSLFDQNLLRKTVASKLNPLTNPIILIDFIKRAYSDDVIGNAVLNLTDGRIKRPKCIRMPKISYRRDFFKHVIGRSQ